MTRHRKSRETANGADSFSLDLARLDRARSRGKILFPSLDPSQICAGVVVNGAQLNHPTLFRREEQN
jgi:hypothetical protein